MNGRGVTLTGKVLRQLKERLENAWTRTQPVELGYHMVAHGRPKCSLPISGFRLSHGKAYGSATKSKRRSPASITMWGAQSDEMNEDSKCGNGQDIAWSGWSKKPRLGSHDCPTKKLPSFVETFTFIHPCPSASQTLECCTNSVETIWSEAVRKGASPQGTCRGLKKFHPKSTDHHRSVSSKVYTSLQSVQKTCPFWTSRKKLQQIAFSLHFTGSSKIAWFLCLWHLRQSCGESAVANPPNPKEFQLGSSQVSDFVRWFMARVPGKAKKLKMKDMYGGWKLQILLGLFQESDFIQSPRLSCWNMAICWNAPLAEDQSWPSDPQIPFEKQFEQHIPPVFFWIDQKWTDRFSPFTADEEEWKDTFSTQNFMQVSNDDQDSWTINYNSESMMLMMMIKPENIHNVLVAMNWIKSRNLTNIYISSDYSTILHDMIW